MKGIDTRDYDAYIDEWAARFEDRATLGPTTEPEQSEVLMMEVLAVAYW